MLIPRTIEIGRARYDISVRPSKDSPYNGAINYTLGIIWINSHDDRTGGTRAPKKLAHSFWHETVHGILRDMKHELYADEKFVDAFAKRLNQVAHSGVVG